MSKLKQLERQALLVQQTSTILMELTPQGQLVFMNPSAKKHFPDLVGLESDQSKSHHPLLASWLRAAESLGAGESLERELSVGEKTYSQKITSHVQNQTFDIYMYDLTRLKLSEAKLLASQAEHRAILEAIPDMVFVMNRDGTYLDFKLDKTHQVLEDLIGRNVRDLSFIPPEIASAIIEKVQQTADTEQSQTLEYSLEGYFGDMLRLTHYEARFARIDASRILMVVRDVSPRKSDELALQEAREHERAILTAMPDMVFVMDKHATYLDYRTSSIALQEPHLGRTIYEISYIPEQLAKEIHHNLKTALAQQAPCSLEYQLPETSGQAGFYEARFVPLSNERVLSIVRDITTRKKLEQELREVDQDNQRQATELVLLEHVRTLISNKPELSVFCKTVSEVVSEVLHYELVGISLIRGDYLEMQHQVGYSTILPKFPANQGIEGRVIRTTKAELVQDVKQDPEYFEVEPHTQSEVCVPLFLSGNVVGVLIVESVKKTLFETDLRILSKLGAYVSLAMEQAQLYQEVKANEVKFRELYLVTQEQAELLAQRANELELLGQVRAMISSKLEPASLFKAVTEAVSQVLGYKFVGIALIKGEHLEVQHQVGYDMTVMPSILDLGQGVIGRVAKTGQSALVPDVTVDPDYVGPTTESTSEICVPLRIQDKVIGVLNTESTTEVLGEAQLETLAQVAVYVGLALEQAQLYQALQTSEVRYRELIENASDIIYRIDLKGYFTYTNSVVKRLLGFAEDEFIGKNYLEIIHPNSRTEAQSFYINQFAKKIPTTYFEFPALNKQGTIIWIGQNVQLVWENHKVIGMQAVARDVTERKRMEEALLKQAEELSSANADLEQFAFIAAHDLQEPLRKIQSFGDRLNTKYKHVLDEQGRDYLARMHGSATRMRTLIDDLLLFAKTTNKQERTLVSLEQIALEVVSDLQGRLEDTHGHIELGMLPTLEADPMQMRQLLQNVLGNALKFHKPGVPPVVKLLSRRVGSEWQIFVQDNGIGFEEKYNDRIFNVFQRLHSRERYEGTGMGLAIVRKIVEGHAGRVEVQSQVGEGTTFILSFPITPSLGKISTGLEVLA
jgi:two-component system, LuxR family, sensor kinase FixL